MTQPPCTPTFQFVDVGKQFVVNNGEFPNDKSQLDSLLFGIASLMIFSSPIDDYKGFIYLRKVLWVSSQKWT